jgi:hypothetical protein
LCKGGGLKLALGVRLIKLAKNLQNSIGKKEEKKEGGRPNNLFHHPAKRESSQLIGGSFPTEKIFLA